MSSLDPLKTVISIGNRDDTSLALPSVNQYRSGAQRVREQVQSIRRTKTRHSSSRSGSTSMSPTSPLSESNGSVFFSNGFSKSLNLDMNMNNHQMLNHFKGSTVRKSVFPGSRYERSFGVVGSTAAYKANTSRSEPAPPFHNSVPKSSVPPQRLLSTRSTQVNQQARGQIMRRTISQPHPMNVPNGSGQIKTQNQVKVGQTAMVKARSMTTVTDGPSKTKIKQGVNGNIVGADITMKEAVEFLSKVDENYQHCGASYIQHNAFVNDKAKEEVLKLKGIPPLVDLLRSSSSQVRYTASAALRNLSFKSDPNKEEIYRCNGIAGAVAQLKDSQSIELDKQLTGLLWNLSSADNLKPDLIKNALPVLMERVFQPSTAGPNESNATERDPDVFFYSTGCLRNLSGAKQNSRQTMRKCRGLVDSLVSYLKDCVEKGKVDDESLENCVCVLHNLTFQLEVEAPALFNRITALAPVMNRNQNLNNDAAVNCFSSQTNKPAEQDRYFDYCVSEDPQPSGTSWLIHSKTLQNYLSVLESSTREESQEACCGAMHNLTANEGIISNVISQIIVKKLKGMRIIGPLLRSDKVNLQRNAITLVTNLMKNPNLHTAISQEALPKLVTILQEGTSGGNESDDTLAMACQSASTLLLKDPERNIQYLKNDLISSLNQLSQNIYFPKSSKAAAILLFKIWSDKSLQSLLKKKGMSKSLFVNDTTMAAYKSAQVVD